MHYVLKKFSTHPLKNVFAPLQDNKKNAFLLCRLVRLRFLNTVIYQIHLLS